MKYRKIHIIGGPGSGKSYSSNKLQQATNLIAYDLDQVFWDQSANTYIRASDELRSENLNHILSENSWIIEGVYYKWLEESFRQADVIVILNPHVAIRQWRIFKRFMVRKFLLGDFRKETFSSFFELWQWNKNFDDDNMVRITGFTSKYKDKIVFCKNYQEMARAINA